MVENRNELVAFFTYCLQNYFPFFAYQLPNSGIIRIGVQTDLNGKAYGSLAELEGANGFVFSPFDTESKHQSWFIRNDLQWEASTIDSSAIKELELHVHKIKVKCSDEKFLESSHSLYFNQVSEMIRDLKQAKLDKVILSRIQILKGMGRKQAADAFLKLSEAYNSAFVSFVSIPNVGNWIGASPETLLSSNENGIETVALAATQKLGKQKLEEISWEKKEREEQAFVSLYIDKVLASHQLRGYKRTGPLTVQAGNVVHLKTTYQLPADLNFSQLSALVQDLHPTPAICGLPKKKAIELIREIEKHDREYYAGYLGPIETSGSFSLFVNLRSMKVLDNQMALFVGGGITADSIPEKEWEETCLKAQTLLNVIRS
jgi:isochorismate synthase